MASERSIPNGSRRSAELESIVKILIVAPAWVGDMVMSHCLVSVLGNQGQADLQIDMLAPPASAPLAQRMPGVTAVHSLDIGHGELGWRKRRTMARLLAERGYDQAIVLPNSFKSALIPYWAGIPRRTGWTGESRLLVLNDRRHLDPERLPMMIERFMALGLAPERSRGYEFPDPYPQPLLRVDQGRADALRAEHGLGQDRVTALCPGAEFGPAKRWPVQHFAALARSEASAGRQVWLIGSPGDRAICAEIETLVPRGLINLAGRTSLLDAVDLLAQADRVVCNDSGLMHVAAALDRHVIALFGSTSPDFTPPLGNKARVLRNPVPCSPCFQRQCPLGHLACLSDLTPEMVIQVL